MTTYVIVCYCAVCYLVLFLIYVPVELSFCFPVWVPAIRKACKLE